jgi:hypothetical protein
MLFGMQASCLPVWLMSGCIAFVFKGWHSSGTWNINLYMAGSLMTVLKELSKYKLDLMGI